ncbi:HK97-gp10 family putative phage morphogenesis protein [Thermodesulfovibrio yellowstonii]|uniref:HK97-gp10 family putative phage morphogenesis protein n=1 Tax=Thermodesulfovibrio yellowstonii TaxID=28262 RepID=UPI0024B33F53|nr:HK97-gp10 family putative phage morphogenesis protein [Thermodesulfovibrio yellowstonii]MDI6865763.1 phage virion morphogenesis protein [Thermodesulfovibrio yellowstonii]
MSDINRVFAEIEQILKRAISETVGKTAQHAESELSRLFASEGASLGVEWSALKESYLRQKIKKGYSEKRLHRTTTLAQSFTSVLQPFTAVVGTPVWYARFHETGTRKTPARPFMKPVMEHILREKIPARYFKETLDAS